uniref:TonB-dependent receptor plug domain-containing protein n=1 Tax=Thaumasiovibrio occultus TaxID=1891184 RepID=UPI00131CD9D8|nr:TonB-dependent receptor [Thaumasiovibrio occultus]
MKHWVLFALLFAWVLPCQAQTDDFLDLDRLMQMDITATTAMKRASSIGETAATVYVLEGNELPRYGVRNVPEALKLVPGVFVRQIDANVWAISSRFAAGQFYSRMLVMVDGQNVYNPTFAGISWEDLDIDIATIERIEVIRGAGGMLWGANATNGVVNIITKHGFDTQGAGLSVGASTQPSGELALRWGGQWGEQTYYRVGLKGARHDKSHQPDNAYDDGAIGSVNVRLDSALTEQIQWQFQARYVDTHISQLTKNSEDLTQTALEETISGENFSLMTRLEHQFDAQRFQQWQVSYQYAYKPQFAIDIKYRSWDLDYQYSQAWQRTQLDVGVYIRHSDVLSDSGNLITVADNAKELDIHGMFLQLEWQATDSWRWIAAGKLDHNNFQGWEFQPSLRTLYEFTPEQIIWLGVSEVTRAPTFGEYAITINAQGTPFGQLYSTGIAEVDEQLIKTRIYTDRDMPADTSLNVEAGYRYTPSRHTFVDLAAYYSRYDNSVSFDTYLDPDLFRQAVILAELGDVAGASAAISQLELQLRSQGDGELDIYGIESVFEYLDDDWHVSLGASWLKLDYVGQYGYLYGLGVSDDIVQLKSRLQYQWTEKLHTALSLTFENSSDIYMTDDYFNATVGGTYQYSQQIQLGLFVKNLLRSDYHYSRDTDIYLVPSEAEPSLYGTVTIGF